MNRFIAYFDFLGFKKFIENNEFEYQRRIVGNIFRDIESTRSLNKFKDAYLSKIIADTSHSLLNCINFSDTVVFFSSDNSDESLKEILEVSYAFNMREIRHFFPVRGALVYGEMFYVPWCEKNVFGSVYNINSIFGKGLVKAHERANEQNWAGTVLDESFTLEIFRKGYILDIFLDSYAKKYKVPYKNNCERPNEYVLNIIDGTMNEVRLKNIIKDIEGNFAQHNKTMDERAKEKLSNTILFVESYI